MYLPDGERETDTKHRQSKSTKSERTDFILDPCLITYARRAKTESEHTASDAPPARAAPVHHAQGARISVLAGLRVPADERAPTGTRQTGAEAAERDAGWRAVVLGRKGGDAASRGARGEERAQRERVGRCCAEGRLMAITPFAGARAGSVPSRPVRRFRCLARSSRVHTYARSLLTWTDVELQSKAYPNTSVAGHRIRFSGNLTINGGSDSDYTDVFMRPFGYKHETAEKKHMVEDTRTTSRLPSTCHSNAPLKRRLNILRCKGLKATSPLLRLL
ncbi:hypothetical protein DFH11DRAFT_1876981 [Phellopilus nigrolimitatus]|nr:hypothetical protein DFH11DRAFT_1876981 [Phellopilus nigrolimitatus]